MGDIEINSADCVGLVGVIHQPEIFELIKQAGGEYHMPLTELIYAIRFAYARVRDYQPFINRRDNRWIIRRMRNIDSLMDGVEFMSDHSLRLLTGQVAKLNLILNKYKVPKGTI